MTRLYKLDKRHGRSIHASIPSFDSKIKHANIIIIMD